MRHCLGWAVVSVVGAAASITLYWTLPGSPWVPACGVFTVLALVQTVGWTRWVDGYRQGARNVIRAVEVTRTLNGVTPSPGRVVH